VRTHRDRCNCNRCDDCIRARAQDEMQASIDLERAVLGKRNPARILQSMVDQMRNQSPPKKRKRRKRPAKICTVHYHSLEE
jgi:hypothetical protein